MAKIDVIKYAIRVIADPDFYGSPYKGVPFDIEGTVLELVSNNRYGRKVLEQGYYLEALTVPEYEEDIDIYVRWDNDKKEWLSGGSAIIRSAKIGYCESIWRAHNHVQVDKRPFHALTPMTYKPTPIRRSIIHSTPKPASVPGYLFIERDGNWHEAMYHGTLGWCRYMVHYEFREDGGPTQVIPGHGFQPGQHVPDEYTGRMYVCNPDYSFTMIGANTAPVPGQPTKKPTPTYAQKWGEVTMTMADQKVYIPANPGEQTGGFGEVVDIEMHGLEDPAEIWGQTTTSIDPEATWINHTIDNQPQAEYYNGNTVVADNTDAEIDPGTDFFDTDE